MSASAPADAERIRELLLDNLFAVFNVRDSKRRLEAIVRHEELNERASELLDGLPGFVFAAAGPVHVSRDLGVLAFNMGLPEQPPAVSGIDVALVRDGRIAVLHTLLTAQN